ncbi:hypothetical protein NLJ89_g3921 [Agrocybe chaxingu]|uniref:Uncharacterized protein n=1 Tax=Agrocybe chaxingu TaxID=84603 RepID=A0A9W8MY26_9AGAR|nr:hypothetical protein NLJ89_g3921 [Agrocybe chaxingu]
MESSHDRYDKFRKDGFHSCGVDGDVPIRGVHHRYVCLSLVGAIVRKLSFTLVYAYILYIHFVINLGVAAYLLYEIMRTSRNAQRLACQTAIKDPQAQDQCSGLLAFAKWVYIAVAGSVLFVEMYGAVIVTRYLNQLKREKSDVSAMQRDTENAFELKRSLNGHNYARLHNTASPNMVPPPDPYRLGPSDAEYNPYEEVSTIERNDTFRHGERPPPPIEVGYGGGSWTHSGIVDEEKERLKRNELSMDAQEASSSRSGNAKRDYEPQQLDGKSLAHEDTPLPLYTQTYHP